MSFIEIGPLVQGYFSVATEIFDDTGRPHTLEHLIFMGSELYPYKGVLDTLANRMFANGTNAWTDTTNTTYTVVSFSLFILWHRWRRGKGRNREVKGRF